MQHDYHYHSERAEAELALAQQSTPEIAAIHRQLAQLHLDRCAVQQGIEQLIDIPGVQAAF